MGGGLLATASPARAWQAGTVGSTLSVQAGAGETNRLDVTVTTGGRLLITDASGAPTSLGPDCSDPEAEGTATCSLAGITRLVVSAADGDDTVTVDDVPVLVDVDGGPGNDTLATGSGDDVLEGGAGHDALDGAGGSDDLRGGTGDDRVAAGSGDDVVAGGDGVDTVDGDLGDDVVDGGDGADQIDGGAGDDRLLGAAGDDALSGGDGDDRLAGGAGQDRLTGEAGRDGLAGGDGADDLDGGSGTDQQDGGTGDDLLASTEGGDRLDGGDGADRLEGDEQTGQLLGGAGDDALSGYGGDDTLDGGDGTDRLDGGRGADDLRGGNGRDTVSYDAAGSGVRVTLDGIADDGAVDERDNAAGDLEIVVGSPLDDTVVAGGFPVIVQAGAGNDVVTGSAGADVLAGGEGDDTIDGAAGPDALMGGEGADTVSYVARATGVSVSVGDPAGDGVAGENDDVQGDVERVLGTRLPDVLSAADGLGVRFEAGAGNDRIALPTLAPGAQATSQASCGTGTDTVVATAEEQVDDDCDIVTASGRLVRLAAQGDGTPRLAVTLRKVRIDAAGRLRVPLHCASETRVRCRVTVRVSRDRRHLGTAKGKIGRGRSGSVLVPLRGRQVPRLTRAGGAVVVTLTVTDRLGAPATATGIVAVGAVR